jgi:hypothetical protein
VNITETTAFVAAANQTDPRVELTDETVHSWHRLIGDLDARDAAAALDRHYRATTDRVMPADIRRLVNGAPDGARHAPQIEDTQGWGIRVPKPEWFDAEVERVRGMVRQRVADGGRVCECIGEHRVSR